jgi:hypothetical protein
MIVSIFNNHEFWKMRVLPGHALHPSGGSFLVKMVDMSYEIPQLPTRRFNRLAGSTASWKLSAINVLTACCLGLNTKLKGQGGSMERCVQCRQDLSRLRQCSYEFVNWSLRGLSRFCIWIHEEDYWRDLPFRRYINCYLMPLNTCQHQYSTMLYDRSFLPTSGCQPQQKLEQYAQLYAAYTNMI